MTIDCPMTPGDVLTLTAAVQGWQGRTPHPVNGRGFTPVGDLLTARDAAVASLVGPPTCWPPDRAAAVADDMLFGTVESAVMGGCPTTPADSLNLTLTLPTDVPCQGVAWVFDEVDIGPFNAAFLARLTAETAPDPRPANRFGWDGTTGAVKG